MTVAQGPGSAVGVESVRLVRAELDGAVVPAMVVGDEVVEVAGSWTDALASMAAGESAAIRPAPGARRAPLATARLDMPIERDAVVYCVGLNYREHAAEAAELADRDRDQPAPIIFVKSPRAMVAPGADLLLPRSVSVEFDWEVELGVVIGAPAVDVPPERAWEYVAGYTVVNDITARDLQKRHQQWHLGKNAPASTPIGPWVIERSAFAWPIDVEVQLLVNGVEKQRSMTSLLLHTIPDLLALLSRTTTLQPGDVIATGTPAGVGFVRVPREFLVDGDVVETVVGGVGALTNVVRTPAALVDALDVTASAGA